MLTEGAVVGIPTYFSHNYRVEGQPLNQRFWQFFSMAGFSFFVDPPSDITAHTHLERMMGRCSAFVAIVNRRRGADRHNCSPFVLYEYGLSIQARRPRLLLIDQNVADEPFQALPPEEKQYFSPNDPAETDDELAEKIAGLTRLARSFPNRGKRLRGKIGLVVRVDGRSCSYAEPEVVERLKVVVNRPGFAGGSNS